MNLPITVIQKFFRQNAADRIDRTDIGVHHFSKLTKAILKFLKIDTTPDPYEDAFLRDSFGYSNGDWVREFHSGECLDEKLCDTEARWANTQIEG